MSGIHIQTLADTQHPAASTPRCLPAFPVHSSSVAFHSAFRRQRCCVTNSHPHRTLMASVASGYEFTSYAGTCVCAAVCGRHSAQPELNGIWMKTISA